MEINVGKTDRIVRVMVGLVIAGLGAYYQSFWGWLAVIPLATAAMAWCPVYSLFGVSSCDKPRANRKSGQKLSQKLGRV